MAIDEERLADRPEPRLPQRPDPLTQSARSVPAGLSGAPFSRRIPAVLRFTTGPSVLDVGCTGGLQADSPDVGGVLWLHGHLRDAFPDVWGVDLSPTKIAALEEAGFSNLVAADAQTLDLDHRFDTVVAGEVIEHVPDPGRFLTSLARHLKPSGRIVLTTPYAFGLPQVLYAWSRYPSTCSNEEHVLWLCPTTMAELARQSGLAVLHWELVEDVSPVPQTLLYRVFRALYPVTRRVVPLRLRASTMLIVLEREPA